MQEGKIYENRTSWHQGRTLGRVWLARMTTEKLSSTCPTSRQQLGAFTMVEWQRSSSFGKSENYRTVTGLYQSFTL